MNSLSKPAHYFIDLLFAVGFGITLHAIANEAYYKGGYSEILSFQGEYIGLIFVVVAYSILRLTLNRKV